MTIFAILNARPCILVNNLPSPLWRHGRLAKFFLILHGLGLHCLHGRLDLIFHGFHGLHLHHLHSLHDDGILRGLVVYATRFVWKTNSLVVLGHKSSSECSLSCAAMKGLCAVLCVHQVIFEWVMHACWLPGPRLPAVLLLRWLHTVTHACMPLRPNEYDNLWLCCVCNMFFVGMCCLFVFVFHDLLLCECNMLCWHVLFVRLVSDEKVQVLKSSHVASVDVSTIVQVFKFSCLASVEVYTRVEVLMFSHSFFRDTPSMCLFCFCQCCAVSVLQRLSLMDMLVAMDFAIKRSPWSWFSGE